MVKENNQNSQFTDPLRSAPGQKRPKQYWSHRILLGQKITVSFKN
jgi:hypothetical protein